jgi:hypothetical protein
MDEGHHHLLCLGRSLTVDEAPYGAEAPIITPTGVAFSFLFLFFSLLGSTYKAHHAILAPVLQAVVHIGQAGGDP